MGLGFSPQAEKLRRLCRKDYKEYVKLTNKEKGFYMAKFHAFLCDKVQAFIEAPSKNNGTFDILLISTPPQCGKTYTVTESLPSWFLGKNPRLSCIVTTYDSDFADGFSKANREKYITYATDIFKDVTDAGIDKDVQAVALWQTNKGGRYRAASLKAGITGYPADLMIIDDPIKNRQEASSETIISRIRAEMIPSVRSRIHPNGKLIVIQTRWVENDVIGYCEEYWGDQVVEYINIPLEAEAEDPEDDPLGRQKGDSIMGPHLGDFDMPAELRKDNDWLKAEKAAILRVAGGINEWNAMFQGHPSAAEGNLFTNNMWQFFHDEADNLTLNECDGAFMSVDAAFHGDATSDPVSIGVWGLRSADALLFDILNCNMTFLQTIKKIKSLLNEHPQISILYIEDKANGSAIIDTLRYDPDIQKSGIAIVAVTPQGGKYSRAQAVSNFAAAKHIWINTNMQRNDDEVIGTPAQTGMAPHEKYCYQMEHFPFAAHDDMVDQTTQFIARAIKMVTGEEKLPQKKVYQKYGIWTQDLWQDYRQIRDDGERNRFIQMFGAPIEWKYGEQETRRFGYY